MKHSPDQSENPRLSKCPICEREVAADVPTFPFCCERCKLVDLGKWFSGRFVISRPAEPEDEFED